MLGKKNDREVGRAFESAKDATRRATFLNAASTLPPSHPNRKDLVLLARTCRAAALRSGLALGKSEAEVDKEISGLFNADVARLKAGTERAVQDFTRESYDITKAFLATVDPDLIAGVPPKH